MTLKQKIADIIKSPVDVIGWDEAFNRAQSTGTLGQAQITSIIKELCKHIDPYIPDHIERPVAVNEQVGVFNPLKEDFTVQYDFSGSGQPMSFTAPAQELKKFDARIATHIKKHLINKILQDRGVKYVTPDEIRKVDQEVSAELYV